MIYQIIEDCSPFYIRFTHPGIEQVINYCNIHTPQLREMARPFVHHVLPIVNASKILEMTPLSKQLSLILGRVSLFMSKPGLYYRAHKDGLKCRISLNYTTQILDDKCITSWYSDDDLKNYLIDTLNRVSRQCVGFKKNLHLPIKTMTAKPNECILFNTDIFHDWDNTQSDNYRVVLTLHLTNPGDVYFDDVKKLLFNL